MIRLFLRCFATASLLALATACSGPSYSHTTIDTVVNPSGGTIDIQHVSVPLGGVLKAHLVAWDSSGHRMSGGVEAVDGSVMNAVNVISGDDDWAFFGSAPGHTTINLLADGEVVRTLEADVVASQ